MHFRVSRCVLSVTSVAVIVTLVAIASTLALNSEGASPSDGSPSGSSSGGTTSLGGTAAGPNPVLAANGGVKNVTFYYGGTIPLVGALPNILAGHLGKPAVVVTTPTADEVATVEAIHSIGAKAYRYVQFYWAPNDASYDGINLRRHPGWAFCREGTKKSVGRIIGSTKW